MAILFDTFPEGKGLSGLLIESLFKSKTSLITYPAAAEKEADNAARRYFPEIINSWLQIIKATITEQNIIITFNILVRVINE